MQNAKCKRTTEPLPGRLRAVTFAFCILHFAFSFAHAYDVQIKTADGQTVTGEFLGTEDGNVKLRSKYGLVAIPQKDVMTMVRAPEAPAQTAGGKDKTPATEPASEAPPATFPEPKDVSLSALLATRIPEPPEPNKQERQEIFRVIRNFHDASDKSRDKILGTLRNFGTVAYPFIASAYTGADELDDRTGLLSALAVRNSPYTAGIFAEARAAALKAFDSASNSPPPPPPDYPTKLERNAPQNPAGEIKAAATRVLAIEADASVAGGPFNSLFLFQAYKKRYSGETDALFKDASRDQLLLAAAAGDAQKSKTEWTGADRAMLAEQAIPLLFKDSEELNGIARELLKKILPSGHPKFEAPQDEWLNWWVKNKDKIEKK